jgi:hypothetical protein
MKIQNTVKWLIENFDTNNGTTELAQTASNLGFEVKLCDITNPFEDLSKYFEPNACVITQTSIQSAFKSMKECPQWIPSAWYKQEFFQCKYYYQFFGSYLFNDKYIMLPQGEVIRQIEFLYNTLGKHDNIFIRPSSACKTFTGQLFDRKNFIKNWTVACNYGGSPTDLVVVSTPKIIKGEYRFVIGDRKVIAGSQYSSDKKTDMKEAPQHLITYVEKVLNDITYDPDPVWILDVALDNDLKPHVLEVGSFSSSGLYACNKHDIVTKVPEIAYREHKEFSPKNSHKNSEN